LSDTIIFPKSNTAKPEANPLQVFSLVYRRYCRPLDQCFPNNFAGRTAIARTDLGCDSFHLDMKGVRVPRQDWSAKRERQYAHIKEGLVDRGDSTDEAEEIAARTVNKSRARSGETKTASRTSLNDISSGRRGGLRSHKGAGGRTRDQLYEEARRQKVKGRSTMTKAQLERAVGR
jgi:hypothetical protein